MATVPQRSADPAGREQHGRPAAEASTATPANGHVNSPSAAERSSDPNPIEIGRAHEAAAEPVDLGRIAWSVAAVGFAIGGLVLLMKGYYGYASVTFAVAVAAAINLL
jgi:hypothetical protein